MIKYTVLTYIPRRPTPPAIGVDVAASIREFGCHKCIVNYDGKLKACWVHKNETILRAITVEAPEEEITNVELSVQTEGLPEMGVTTGVEELVEV